VLQCSLALSFHQRCVLRGEPVGLLKVRQRAVCQLKQCVRACVHVQSVLGVKELCAHVYLCTGCSKNGETVRAYPRLCTGRSKCRETTRACLYFVQDVLKVSKLCVRMFIFVQNVLKI
jgi:hypothetical protein